MKDLLGKVKGLLIKGSDEKALELIDSSNVIETAEEHIMIDSIINLIELNNIDEAIEEIEDIINADEEELDAIEVVGTFSDEQIDFLNRTTIEELPHGTQIESVVLRKIEEQNNRELKLSTIAEDIIDVLESFKVSGKKAFLKGGGTTAVFQKEVYDYLKQQGLINHQAVEDESGKFSSYIHKSGRSLYLRLDQHLPNNTERNEYYIAELDYDRDNQYILSVKTTEDFLNSYVKELDSDANLQAMINYSNFLKVAEEFKNKIDYQLFNDVQTWLR